MCKLFCIYVNLHTAANSSNLSSLSFLRLELKSQIEQDGRDETNGECRKDEFETVTEADECDQKEAVLEDESEVSEDDDDTVKGVNENATALGGEGEKDMVKDDDLDLNTETDKIVKTENSNVKVDENVTSDRVNEIKKDKNVHSSCKIDDDSYLNTKNENYTDSVSSLEQIGS